MDSKAGFITSVLELCTIREIKNRVRENGLQNAVYFPNLVCKCVRIRSWPQQVFCDGSSQSFLGEKLVK